MKNSGKRFEDNFRLSVPKGIFYYRLKDSSNSWSNGNVRFTPSNIADSFMFDGITLYILELKSCKGKSLPITNIREHQINDLLETTNYTNIISGFVIEFSELDECYFLPIMIIEEFLKQEDRKSIPVDYCNQRGIKIDVEKKRVNRRFDIGKFIRETRR